MVFFFFLQTHLTFGKEFTQAVELKQVAQQDAEKARFLVEKVTIMRISITTFLSHTYNGLQVLPHFICEHKCITDYIAHFVMKCLTLISSKGVAK
jgi:phage FluMu protein gp41